VEISSHVAQALNEIRRRKCRQVDDLVTEVASASREQTDGIMANQCGRWPDGQGDAEQRGCAEESAAAAEELNYQAEAMKQSVAELLQLVGGRSKKGKTPVQVHFPATYKGLHQTTARSQAARSHQRQRAWQRPRSNAPAKGRGGQKRRSDTPADGNFMNFLIQPAG